MDSNLLRLIGLCKKAGRLEVGEEPAGSACRARDCRLLLTASDAADNTVRRAAHFAEAGSCLQIQLPFTRDELGRAVGRSSCALAAVTDIGFASAVAKRLAAADPKAYGEIARRLDIKARRAAERRKEQPRHGKKPLEPGQARPPVQGAALQPREPKGPAAQEQRRRKGAASPVRDPSRRAGGQPAFQGVSRSGRGRSGWPGGGSSPQTGGSARKRGRAFPVRPAGTGKSRFERTGSRPSRKPGQGPGKSHM